MPRYRAPMHRLDHAPQWISHEDDAWNVDVVLAAYKGEEYKVDGETIDLTPLRLYLTGQSRYDLQASDLQEVLAATGCLDLARAEVWTLRVLPYDSRSKANQHFQASHQARGARQFGLAEAELAIADEHAFLHGVVNLRSPFDDEQTTALCKVLEELPKDRSSAVRGQLFDAVAAYRFSAIAEVGAAVRNLSDDLLREERRV